MKWLGIEIYQKDQHKKAVYQLEVIYMMSYLRWHLQMLQCTSVLLH